MKQAVVPCADSTTTTITTTTSTTFKSSKTNHIQLSVDPITLLRLKAH